MTLVSGDSVNINNFVDFIMFMLHYSEKRYFTPIRDLSMSQKNPIISFAFVILFSFLAVMLQNCSEDPSGNKDSSSISNVDTSGNNTDDSGDDTLSLLPPNISITTGNQQLLVSWEAVSGAESYNVYWSQSSDGTYPSYESGITTTTYTIENLQNYTTYYIAVKSASNSVESIFSSQKYGIPSIIVTPEISLKIGDKTIYVSWDSISGVEGYYVFYGTSSGAPYEDFIYVASPLNNTELTDLTNGTTYYVSVKSVYLNIESDYSSEQTAKPYHPVAGPRWRLVRTTEAGIDIDCDDCPRVEGFWLYFYENYRLAYDSTTNRTWAWTLSGDSIQWQSQYGTGCCTHTGTINEDFDYMSGTYYGCDYYGTWYAYRSL